MDKLWCSHCCCVNPEMISGMCFAPSHSLAAWGILRSFCLGHLSARPVLQPITVVDWSLCTSVRLHPWLSCSSSSNFSSSLFICSFCFNTSLFLIFLFLFFPVLSFLSRDTDASLKITSMAQLSFLSLFYCSPLVSTRGKSQNRKKRIQQQLSALILFYMNIYARCIFVPVYIRWVKTKWGR